MAARKQTAPKVAKAEKAAPVAKAEKAAPVAKAEKAAPVAKAEKAAPVAKAEKAPVDRSAAISASWADKNTRAARSLKSKVKVAGVEYRSVADAFTQLGLPMGRHIGFRAELKASETGKATFKTEDGAKHNFALVAQAAE